MGYYLDLYSSQQKHIYFEPEVVRELFLQHGCEALDPEDTGGFVDAYCAIPGTPIDYVINFSPCSKIPGLLGTIRLGSSLKKDIATMTILHILQWEQLLLCEIRDEQLQRSISLNDKKDVLDSYLRFQQITNHLF